MKSSSRGTVFKTVFATAEDLSNSPDSDLQNAVVTCIGKCRVPEREGSVWPFGDHLE